MHLTLFNESFYFCPRDDLESLQLVRKSLLNMIVARSNVLSLRPIYKVVMDPLDAPGKIQIHVARGADTPDYEASIHDGDFAETVLRLQNTCIKNFSFGVRDSPFLRYWKAQQPASFTVVSIYFGPLGTTDYEVLGSIVNHLRPRSVGSTFMPFSSVAERLEVLARNSLLNNLQTCRLNVWHDSFPPSAFFLNDPGYRNYELRCDADQVADGIDGIIESFVRDGCVNNKLESVYIQWINGEGPQSTAPKRLSKPTKTDMPLPKTDMTEWATRDTHRVIHCEMHAFVNEKQWKRMDVYKWSAERNHDSSRCTVHVLQCRMVNL
ncbi:hypothetical protein AAVH_32257 [Aphelenchoides avenae]|nr:hypothetical protein AAVH_32257 [Aphelenchus avenae]